MAASKQQPKTSSRGHTTIQLGNGVSGGGGGRAAVAQRRLKPRVEKPRQEICAPLKWTCFLINFVIFLASVGCLALGLYLFVNDPRPVAELADFLLNPAVLLAVVGLLSGVVALFGLFGALRDNVFLLKMFALCVFLAYLLLVVCTCLLFLLFYSDATGIDPTKGAISAQSVLLYSIGRYNANKNVADFIDYLQEQMECCGSTSFRDWHLSEQFSCNATNPYPERCGVPFSCCRRSVVSGAGPAGANGGGQQKPLSPAIRSIKCWQNAQKKREQELDQDIYVAGCLQPLRSLFDAHALHIGMAVVSVIMPVCLGVCLSQCLARQIDYQHFLLKREQRRLERRERREHRYTRAGTGGGQAEQSKQHKKASISSQSELMERGELPPAPEMPRRPPPKAPPPPTPRNDAEAAAMAAAIKASKLEWAKEQLRRSAAQHTRAASFSPRRNLGVGGKEEAAGSGKQQLQQAKRKSMTLDMAEPVASSSSKSREKEARKRRPITAESAKKSGGGGGRERSKQQQQQPRNCSQPPVAPVQPSAPPIFLTLQQHHFQ